MQELLNEQVQNCVPICDEVETKAIDNTQESASYGKFKTADALHRAYNELEKEFTKKCQVVNKLSEKSNIDIDKRIQDFKDVNPNLAKFADDIAKIYQDGGVVELEIAKLLNGQINAPAEIINDENFLNSFVFNNVTIKEHFVDSYIEELSQNKLPKSIANKGKTLLAPVYRPRSLNEAGRIAEEFIENRRL